MSGGAFDYQQHAICDIADSIQRAISRNTMVPYEEPHDDWELDMNKEFLENGGTRFSKPVITQFKRGLEFLRKAYIYAQRIDWVLSGDDGEEEFLKRLKEDLDTFTFTS